MTPALARALEEAALAAEAGEQPPFFYDERNARRRKAKGASKTPPRMARRSIAERTADLLGEATECVTAYVSRGAKPTEAQLIDWLARYRDGKRGLFPTTILPMPDIVRAFERRGADALGRLMAAWEFQGIQHLGPLVGDAVVVLAGHGLGSAKCIVRGGRIVDCASVLRTEFLGKPTLALADACRRRGWRWREEDSAAALPIHPAGDGLR